MDSPLFEPFFGSHRHCYRNSNDFAARTPTWKDQNWPYRSENLTGKKTPFVWWNFIARIEKVALSFSKNVADRVSVTSIWACPLWGEPWVRERPKCEKTRWDSYWQKKTYWLCRNFNPIEKSPSELLEKRGRRCLSECLFWRKIWLKREDKVMWIRQLAGVY